MTSSVEAKTSEDDLASVLRQSEAEYFEQAIQDSLAPDSTDHTELALLEHAKQASLHDAAKSPHDAELQAVLEISKLSDDEILQQVLAESMRQSAQSAMYPV